MRTVWFSTIALMIGFGHLSAQSTPVTSVLIRSPASVRSAGFNGAAVALVGDAGAIFSNPASISTIRNIALEGSFRSAPLGGRVATGALAWRLKQFDLGVGLQFLDGGTKLGQALDSVGGVVPRAPSERFYEFLSQGSFVYRHGIIAVGGTVRLIRQEVDQELNRSVSVDGGLTIPVFDLFALAFSYQNIGGNVRGNSNLEIPSIKRLGFTMNYVDPQESFRLLSTAELQWPEGKGTRLVVGGEAGVVLSGVGFRARIGFASSNHLDNRSSLTYGASLELGRTNIDWAVNEIGLLDETIHRVGIRLRI